MYILVVLISFYASLTSCSPTFSRYYGVETKTEHENNHQLQVGRNDTATQVELELLQSVKNLSVSELQLLNDLLTIRLLRQEGGLENVGEIIQGVLGGEIGTILSGTSSFIGNANAQEEAEFIFGNVAPVFDTILKYGIQGLKQYLGIGVSTTTVAPAAVTQKPPVIVPVFINANQSSLTEADKERLYQQQLIYEINLLQQKLQEMNEDADLTTFSSVVAKTEEDADLDIVEGGKDELFANYPLLVQSRVERVR